MCFAFLKLAISAGLARFCCQIVKYLKLIAYVSVFGGQDTIKGLRKKLKIFILS